jgi:hypothetical protein
MRPSRLFHTLVVCGAALTGGAVATVVAASVAGCCDSAGPGGFTIIDAAVPRDMSVWVIIDAMFSPRDLARGD